MRTTAVMMGAMAALAVSGATSASAQVVQAQAWEPPAPPRDPVWEATAGVRTLYIKGAGYDPFSSNDALVQFSLSASRAVVRSGPWTLAAGLALDVGGSSSSARGDHTSLSLTRLSGLAEARYQSRPRYYLFGRLLPGYLHGSASLEELSSPVTSNLSASFDTFAFDVSAGGALRLADVGLSRVGVWLTADGGYAWAPAEHLVLSPDLGADQSKAGGVDLGSLAVRGGFFRIALALSY